MADSFKELEKRIGHKFSDSALLNHALTHASAALAEGSAGYERLEFLGDRVLGLVIADALYQRFPSEPEGDLAMRLNAMVRAETCAEVAVALDLGSAIRLSKGEDRAGVRTRAGVLSDVMESVIGALYLDGGLGVARHFVETHWGPRLDAMGAPPRDAKTELQEWAQSKQMGLPAYRAVGRSGPDHAPLFEIEVSVAGVEPATGTGSSKRAAEQSAATAMLQREGIRP
jgi:ribonuclease III